MVIVSKVFGLGWNLIILKCSGVLSCFFENILVV